VNVPFPVFCECKGRCNSPFQTSIISTKWRNDVPLNKSLFQNDQKATEKKNKEEDMLEQAFFIVRLPVIVNIGKRDCFSQSVGVA